MSRILLVEDCVDLADGLGRNLEIEGHEVKIEHDGERGLSVALGWPPDLVILDLMIPKIDGYQVLAKLRIRNDSLPVLILSARGTEVDKVQGFRLGADDYMTKPFGVLELIARVEALLRRSRINGHGRQEERSFTFGDVAIDVSSRSVTRHGKEVGLAPKEFDLLMALVDQKGAVISRYDLLVEVWGVTGKIMTRTVDTHIAQLRRKLEETPAHPRHILTVRKAGYRFHGAANQPST